MITIYIVCIDDLYMYTRLFKKFMNETLNGSVTQLKKYSLCSIVA